MGNIKAYLEKLNIKSLPGAAAEYLKEELLNDSDLDLLSDDNKLVIEAKELIDSKYPEATEEEKVEVKEFIPEVEVSKEKHMEPTPQKPTTPTETKKSKKKEYLEAIEALQVMVDITKGKEKKEYKEAIEAYKVMADMEAEEFKNGGSVRGLKEINALLQEARKKVEKLTPKEITEMWNTEAGAVVGGISEPLKIEEVEKSPTHYRTYLKDLLFEKQLTEPEYETYFEDGGTVKGKYDVNKNKTWTVNINMPLDTPGKYKIRKEEFVLGRLSDEEDVKQAILRKQHGSGGEFLGNGRVVSIVEKKEDGGEVEVDLFEHYELLPQEVQDILLKYGEKDENTYENCEALLAELKPLGYTFEYGLDGIPYGLKKIDTNGSLDVLIEIIEKQLTEHEKNPEYDAGGEEINKVFDLFNKEVFNIEDNEGASEYLLKATTPEALKFLKSEVLKKDTVKNYEELANIVSSLPHEIHVGQEGMFRGSEVVIDEISDEVFYYPINEDGNYGGTASILQNVGKKEFIESFTPFPSTREEGMRDAYISENRYSGHTPEQVWNALSPEQRLHLLKDHQHKWGGSEIEILEGIAKKQFSEIPVVAQKTVTQHVSEGQYKRGGIVNQYEGKTPKQVWEELTPSQRNHFLLDHIDVIGSHAAYQSNTNYDNLQPETKEVLRQHIEEGQYGLGGKIKGHIKGLFNRAEKRKLARPFILSINYNDGKPNDVMTFSNKEEAEREFDLYAKILSTNCEIGLFEYKGDKKVQEIKKEKGKATHYERGGAVMPYTVRTIVNYDGNTGDADIDTESFSSLEDAEKYYNEQLKEKSTGHGTYTLIELLKSGEEEPLKEAYQESEMLPEGSVVVGFEHSQYMGYAYNIIDVELVHNKKYSDLRVTKDRTFTAMDEVYQSVDDLKESYEKKYGIMGKLGKGAGTIEEFLKEQEVPGYINEEEEFKKGGKVANQPLPKKGTPEYHKLQIAKRTVRMHPAVVGVMGGMSYDKALQTLKEYGLEYKGEKMGFGGAVKELFIPSKKEHIITFSDSDFKKLSASDDIFTDRKEHGVWNVFSIYDEGRPAAMYESEKKELVIIGHQEELAKWLKENGHEVPKFEEGGEVSEEKEKSLSDAYEYIVATMKKQERLLPVKTLYGDGTRFKHIDFKEFEVLYNHIKNLTEQPGFKFESGGEVGEWQGTTMCINGCFLGETGFKKMVAISKENPTDLFQVMGDNRDIGSFWMQNGKFAKAETWGNANYDFSHNKVSLKGKANVIYKFKKLSMKVEPSLTGKKYEEGGVIETEVYIHKPKGQKHCVLIKLEDSEPYNMEMFTTEAKAKKYAKEHKLKLVKVTDVSELTKEPKIKAISERFARLLTEHIGEEKFKEVIKLNKEEKDTLVCHSHDFCDANMTMLEAFKEEGYDLDNTIPYFVNNDTVISAWNKAWTLAKKNNFYTK